MSSDKVVDKIVRELTEHRNDIIENIFKHVCKCDKAGRDNVTKLIDMLIMTTDKINEAKQLRSI